MANDGGNDGMIEAAAKVTETVSTPDLHEGDVVLVHSMRILLGERHEVPGDPDGYTLTVVHFPGRILNVAEVDADGFVPRSWRNQAGHEPGAYWPVQGNARATWLREITDARR